MIIILLFLLLIIILFGLKISFYITEDRLIIYLFGIKVFTKKDDEYINFISNLVNKNNFQNYEFIDKSLIYFRYVDVKYVNVSLKTVVNNFRSFYLQNLIGLMYLNYIFPLVNRKIKRLEYKFIEGKENAMSLFIATKINVVALIILFLKGKIKNARKTNK
jgi:hypothetical protein